MLPGTARVKTQQNGICSNSSYLPCLHLRCHVYKRERERESERERGREGEREGGERERLRERK